MALGALVLAGCDAKPGNYFTRLAEARERTAALRVQFDKAADASNLAVMADTDVASVAFVAQAEEAKKAVRQALDALLPLLQALDYAAELQSLQEFSQSFAEYERLDQPILELAVENTNLKAQRLSFGPEREAAAAFREALEAYWHDRSPSDACRAAALVYKAVEAVREIQVLEGPHIAEADDAVMTKLEQDMDGLRSASRAALGELTGLAGKGPPDEHLAAASGALARFEETHAQIIGLSRKNTNVRSLALSLGRKRTVITACDVSLAALQSSLAAEGLKATR